MTSPINCCRVTTFIIVIIKASIVAGFGASLVFSPSLVVVGEYFEKRRGLAIGIATAGSGAGGFCGPLLMIYLFGRYGFSGTLFVVGAIIFNSCVSGALYRPLEQKVQKHVRSPHFKLGADVPECLALEPRPNDGSREDGSREDETTSCGKVISRVSYTEGYVTHTKTVDNSTSGDVIADGNRSSRIRYSIRHLCKALDISLWKDWCFVLYALSQAFSIMANKSVFIFTPAVAIDNGMSESQGAYILSAIAAGDFVGRFTSGLFFDLSAVRRHRYRPFSTCMFLVTISILLWPFIKSFVAVITNAVLFGFFYGITIAQRTTIICDLFGVDRLSSATGMSVASMGVGVLIGPYLAGKFRFFIRTFRTCTNVSTRRTTALEKCRQL